MPGYKHSDVGVIPDDWDATQLGGLVRITSGASPSLFRFTGNGILYFRWSSSAILGSILAVPIPRTCSSVASVPARSVVFAKRGAAIALNKVRILNQESFMDTNLMALTPQDLDWEYLFYALGYIGLWRFADTTSVPQINNKHVKPLAFPLPTVDEQRAIAKALSDADECLPLLTK
jgi:type I restriction enzyme S subunit